MQKPLAFSKFCKKWEFHQNFQNFARAFKILPFFCIVIKIVPFFALWSKLCHFLHYGENFACLATLSFCIAECIDPCIKVKL